MKHSCSRLPSLPSPALSSFLPLYLYSLLLISLSLSSCLISHCSHFFTPMSVFITLSNILSVIYFLFFRQKQASFQSFISDFCVVVGVVVVLRSYFKAMATVMLTAVEAQLRFTKLPVTALYCRYGSGTVFKVFRVTKVSLNQLTQHANNCENNSEF